MIVTRTARCRLIVLPLLLAASLTACQRSDSAKEPQGEASESAARLMPRTPDQRPRVDTSGGNRITCSKRVESVPCEP